jgi:hypothetical protein
MRQGARGNPLCTRPHHLASGEGHQVLQERAGRNASYQVAETAGDEFRCIWNKITSIGRGRALRRRRAAYGFVELLYAGDANRVMRTRTCSPPPYPSPPVCHVTAHLAVPAEVIGQGGVRLAPEGGRELLGRRPVCFLPSPVNGRQRSRRHGRDGRSDPKHAERASTDTPTRLD